MTTPEASDVRFARTSLRNTVNEAAAQIESIIDSAERVAEQIQEEAAAKADAYLEQRRSEAERLFESWQAELEAMTSTLVERARALQGDAETLAGEVERTLSALSRSSPVGGEGTRGWAGATMTEGVEPSVRVTTEELSEPLASLETPPTPALSAEARGALTPPSGLSEQVRQEALLRATQMAIGRSDRAEIEAALRAEFSLAEPGAIADEVLGPAER